MGQVTLFKIGVFTAAFLLFQIELIVAKFLLPHFGGSYAVWGACVVFFQTILLLGYVFANKALQRFGIYRYRYIQIVLLFIPFLFFPGRPLTLFPISNQLPIVFQIFGQLTLNIGAVFFILSTISIVYQVWLAESVIKERENPYILFGVSNLGSFAGLCTYPFLFEVCWGLDKQMYFWRTCYVLFIVLNILLLWFDKERTGTTKNCASDERVNTDFIVPCLLYSAAGVVLFLSVTNLVTWLILPIPLFWVIPLAIYLISFTLNFKSSSWCPRWIEQYLHAFIGLGILLFFFLERKCVSLAILFWGLCGVLFIFCMFCQRQIYQLRPNESTRLPFYYVIISLGGFLGGLFVSWIIPIVSDSLIEFLMGIFFITLAGVFAKRNFRMNILAGFLVILCLVILTFWPRLFPYSHWWMVLILIVIFCVICLSIKQKLGICILVGCIVSGQPFVGYYWQIWDFQFKKRNFYGIYRVYDDNGTRYLMHGQILHGGQYLDKEKHNDALLYYAKGTPIADLLTSPAFSFSRIGMIGLGVGSLLAYAQPGQHIDYFELDKDVYQIAKDRFDFLNNARANVNVTIGDARLTLKEKPDKYYDLIVVDAFSGDSVPVHLLTVEAFQEYRKHLTPKGIVVFHISNLYLHIGRALVAVANAADAHFSYQIKSVDFLKGFKLPSSWVAVTWNDDQYRILVSKLDWNPKQPEERYIPRAWTDNYSNILSVLEVNKFLDVLKR